MSLQWFPENFRPKPLSLPCSFLFLSQLIDTQNPFTRLSRFLLILFIPPVFSTYPSDRHRTTSSEDKKASVDGPIAYRLHPEGSARPKFLVSSEICVCLFLILWIRAPKDLNYVQHLSFVVVLVVVVVVVAVVVVIVVFTRGSYCPSKAECGEIWGSKDTFKGAFGLQTFVC